MLKASEIMEDMQISKSVFYKLREECLHSPYKDAVVQLSRRDARYKADRWYKFISWRSDKIKAEMDEEMGITHIRYRRA